MFEIFHFLSSFDAYLAQTDARYPEDRNTFLRLQREETLYDVLCVLLGMGKQTSEKTLIDIQIKQRRRILASSVPNFQKAPPVITIF